MNILDQIIGVLPDGGLADIRIGAHWTAVVATIDANTRCGLATSVGEDRDKEGEIRANLLSFRQIHPLGVRLVTIANGR